MSSRSFPQPASFTNDGSRIAIQAGQYHAFGPTTVVQQAQDPLSQLPHAADAPFNSFAKRHEPSCLENTRVGLLNEIHSWVEGQDERCIFWLRGLAGTGKSTIARTVARRYYDKQRLAASFFFSRGGGDVGHAAKFATSIAVQLAHNVPALREHICDAIVERGDIASQSFRDQWQHLVLRPLSKLDNHYCQKYYILVIDALDECADERDIRIILHSLAEVRSCQRLRLRVFLTSRPEISIRHGFGQIPEQEFQHLTLQNISPSVVDRDIANFLKHSFEAIRQERCLTAGWPGEDVIGKLVKVACGLFIWAATACRFIRQGKRFAITRLDTILRRSGDTVTEPEKHLDEIYTTVLSQSVVSEYSDEEKRKSYDMLRHILGSLCVLISPLSASSLHKLLHVTEDDIDQTLEDLHSVVNIPKDRMQPIRLHHPSFRDYLLSRDRCSLIFWVDEMQAHRILVNSCLRLLSKYLQQDICKLNDPGLLAARVKSSRLEQFLPLELRYACRNWVEHLQKSGMVLRDDEEIHIFLQKHLLHWLEALGWMSEVSQGIHAVMVLESIAAKQQCTRLFKYVHDARRFVLSSRQTIEQAPLQIYSSALVFAPTMSIIREQFRDCIPRWIQQLPNVRNNWSLVMQTLEGHSKSVSAIAFSRDGKTLASACCKMILLWDTATGALINTFECDSVHIRVIAFSPDGKLLASTQEDMAVKLWEADTGAVLQMLKDHLDLIDAVAFSPDSKLLVSASCDRTIKLWDVGTGAVLQTLEGHRDGVDAVAFSPDGRLLMSADNQMIKLWNSGSETVLETRYHWGSVHKMSFSTDGKLLTGIMSGKTVILWDTGTGALLQMLKDHLDFIDAVAFSPDSKLLVSASRDRIVKLWDTGTGALINTFESDSVRIRVIAFSPDGKLLALGSDDKTVQMWDAGAGQVLQPPRAHSSSVNTVAFSPDGKLLASASYDQTVKLWDVGTGLVLHTLADYSGSFTQGPGGRWQVYVHNVVFSPNSKLLAMASNDIIRLHDASSGVVLKTLEGHKGHVGTVAFSSDSKLLITVSWGQTIFWDVLTGAALQTLEGYQGSRENSAAFSPDGKLAALASSENTVKLLEVGSGAVVRTLEGHQDSVNAVAFSPDGKLLASSAWDQTIMLWGIAHGVVLQTFEVDTVVRSLLFSCDGNFLETEVGLLSTLPASLVAGGVTALQNRTKSMFLKEQWVTRGTENVLWLPPEYRPHCTALSRNIVALGLPTGRVVFMQFTR